MQERFFSDIERCFRIFQECFEGAVDWQVVANYRQKWGRRLPYCKSCERIHRPKPGGAEAAQQR
eukprot:1519564-Amphidinium_carterae.1